MIKNILICADDYAQNEAISEGILILAKNRKINAISCLVNSPNWQESSRKLKAVQNHAYLGLHFNLSFGQALSARWQKNYSTHFGKLSSLIQQSYLRRLDKECIEAEFCAQLDAFRQQLGQDPDFIDGHQHVHQLPLIREVMLKVYKQRQLAAFFRNTSNDWRDFLSPKPLAIALLGGFKFKRLLKEQTIQTNSSFSGFYNFVNAKKYRYYFNQFLKLINTEGLIMCHPGVQSRDLNDPLHHHRHHEFNYFMGTAFPNDLQNAQCRLAQKPC